MSSRLYPVYLHLKLVGLALLVLFNILQFHLLPLGISQRIFIGLNRLFIALLNVTLRVHGSLSGFQTDNLLVMSNHYDGVLDANILFYLNNQRAQPLWTVVKASILCDADDKHPLLKMMACLKTAFIRSSYFIPYVRGDKADGALVKDTLLTYLKTKKNILIFPEGTTRKNGVPLDFKNGIFQLAAEQGLKILPVTLKFHKDIGTERGEPLNPLDFFDNVLDVYIHEVIEGPLDFRTMKQKVFEALGGCAAPPAPPAI